MLNFFLGTGKTATVCAYLAVQLSYFDNQKMLVAAPSHAAVDTLLKVFVKQYNDPSKFRCLRLGNSSKISPDVWPYTESFQCADRKKSPFQVLNESNVVFATLMTITNRFEYLFAHHFDVGVIDECAVAIEALCWPMVLAVQKLVLLGDPYQLSPVILSGEPGLYITMMARLMELHQNNLIVLKTQYRMYEPLTR